MENYILSIDAGTTSSRAIVFNKKGKSIGMSQYEFTQFFPKEGWVEHDPLEIWETQLKAIREVFETASIGVNQIHAMGITNQRETTVIWNRKTGIPVYNAIVWQDRRTASTCQTLNQKGLSPFFYEKTGLSFRCLFFWDKN